MKNYRGLRRVLVAFSLVLGGVGLAIGENATRREAAGEERVERKTSSQPIAGCSTPLPSVESVFKSYGIDVSKNGNGKRVLRIEVHDVIDLGVAPFIERVLDDAAKAGDVALVLIHMNTPGGRLDAARQIKDVLLKSKVPTATYIDTDALSAGAFIAYATDFIIVTDGSTIGAATPIKQGQKGEAQAVGEKFVSAVRAMFRSTAIAKGRDGNVAEAMVDKDVEVAGLIEKGKLLTLSSEQALKHCVANFKVANESEILTRLNLSDATVEKPSLNWAERIARVLTGPMVSSLLMTFGFLGLLMELYTPGFGVAGTIGLICLGLFFFGHSVVNLVGLEEVLLFIVGLVLLGIEIFVTPGFGIAGVLGIISVMTGVILAMVDSDLSFSWQTGNLGSALTRTAIAMVGTVVVFVIAIRFLPRAPFLNRLILSEQLTETAFETNESEPTYKQGDEGVALSDIPGSGKGRFAGRTVDVVSQGEFIQKGDSLVIVSVRAGQIIVAKVVG